jgi:hypothetical protein
VGLERGPLSLVRTIEDLLGRNCSGFGLENRRLRLGIRCADHVTSSIRKDGRSIGMVRLWTEKPWNHTAGLEVPMTLIV